MQFLKVAHELITDKNITSNEFRIYTYLLSLYNKAKKSSYPSIEVIAIRTNISISTVKRSIKKLVALGYMKITKRAGINGNYNEYSEFKFLVSNEKQDSTKASVEQTLGEKEIKTEESSTKESIRPLIVSDCKESGLQITIDDVEEVKIKQHPNNSKIAKAFEKSKTFKLSKWLLDRVAYIDETIVDIVLQEKPKTAKLFLVKCIEKTLLAGLELVPIIKNTLNFYSKKDIDYAGASQTKYSSDFYMIYTNRQIGLI